MKEQPPVTLKTVLSRALALRLPNLDKPFTLYIHEQSGTALGVLTQKLAYFSKQLNLAAQMAKLPIGSHSHSPGGNEASKLTPGQHLGV